MLDFTQEDAAAVNSIRVSKGALALPFEDLEDQFRRMNSAEQLTFAMALKVYRSAQELLGRTQASKD